MRLESQEERLQAQEQDQVPEVAVLGVCSALVNTNIIY